MIIAGDELRRATVGATVLEIVVGNIVTETTDAIVNPAQTSLFPGGGVDGEIHLWGGSRIWQECRDLSGCATGEAKITTGGNLPAKYVIHTVGPIWSGGNAGEAVALAMCYRSCLDVASENRIRTLAFPAVSTGDYAYPMEEAAQIAVRTVIEYLQKPTCLQLVRFVLKGRRAYDLFGAAFDRYTGSAASVGALLNVYLVPVRHRSASLDRHCSLSICRLLSGFPYCDVLPRPSSLKMQF